MFKLLVDKGGWANWHVCNPTYDYGQQRISGVPRYFDCADNTIDLLNNPQTDQIVFFADRKTAELAGRWLFGHLGGEFEVAVCGVGTVRVFSNNKLAF